MSHVLQDLLDNNAPSFEVVLSDLEQAAGGDGVDTRLIGDIGAKAQSLVQQLGIDPTDSTAQEVYAALNAYVGEDKPQDIFYETDYVLARYGSDVVSFNLIDILENANHQLSFEKRVLTHGREALQGEIVSRYAAHPRTDEAAVTELAVKAGLADKPQPEESATTESAPTGSYILALGDIFTDAFIKLNEDVARVDTDADGSKRISLPLGSKPPYDEVDIVRAVGPAPNAAVALARLGVSAGLTAFLGDDSVGYEAIDYLKNEKVDTSTVSVQKGLKTSYYYVLRYGAERTILVKNEAFEYTWQTPPKVPEWIYLALISDASWEFHEQLLDYLDKHPETKLAFQPGTFHFKWGVEKLAALYKRSHIIIVNREEAADITGRSLESIRELANGLHDLGPQKVVITDGPSGSYASYDFKLVTIPNYPDPGPPVDRTGAGDAFASTIVGSLALGESMDTALTWAPINSMSVVQAVGAQAGLLGRDKIEEYLAKAPENYKLTDFEG